MKIIDVHAHIFPEKIAAKAAGRAVDVAADDFDEE